MDEPTPITKKLNLVGSPTKIFVVVLILAGVSGIGTGYYLAQTAPTSQSSKQINLGGGVKLPQQDTKTFRDFAEGKITPKPEAKNGEYSEGTHLLIRDGAQPVALTSSVVDLSQFEGKKVKVYGETQKALKQGWLMDVGKVEEK